MLRELGRGGMGRVYEVTHPDLPGRRFALKLTLATGERPLRRFEREVELLGRVRHPGVVGIHAAGRAPEGPWMVMDLVEGRSLALALKEQGAFPPARAGEIALALAEALAALHAAGLLHRDLKPGNVMLRPDGAPVLVDFGLAWAEDVDRLTRTGAMIGTPTYLAPELLLPEPARPDPTLDVWGLGTVLYALLSGEAPFEHSSSFPDTVRRIVEEEPRWPPAPAPLLRVLRRALSKRPGERQADAGEFAVELRRALAEGAGPAPRRVPRGLVLLAGAALLAAGVALGLRARDAGAAPAPVPGPHPDRPAATPVATPAPAAPPRWQRLEHPGAERAAAAFVPDGSGRLLCWAGPDASPGPSELVEWRLDPARGAAPTGRRWELREEVALVALAGARALLLVDDALLCLDLDQPEAQPRALALPPFSDPIDALALQADGRRCAVGSGGDGTPLRVVTFRLEDGQARLEGEQRLSGRRAAALLLEPERLIVAAFGSVGANGLALFPAGGGAPARVPTTTGPTALARDPLGGLWLGTESYFVHLADPATGLVAPQLSGLGAQSHFEAPGGGLMRPPSHNGIPVALGFVRDPLLLLSLSSNGPGWLRPPEAPTPEQPRELRVWAPAAGGRGGLEEEWRNVGGVGRWPEPLSSMDVSSDGAWVLVGHGGALELWARSAIPALGPEDRRLPAWEQVVTGLRRP